MNIGVPTHNKGMNEDITCFGRLFCRISRDTVSVLFPCNIPASPIKINAVIQPVSIKLPET